MVDKDCFKFYLNNFLLCLKCLLASSLLFDLEYYGNNVLTFICKKNVAGGVRWCGEMIYYIFVTSLAEQRVIINTNLQTIKHDLRVVRT